MCVVCIYIGEYVYTCVLVCISYLHVNVEYVLQMDNLTKCGRINLALCYRPISGRLIVTIMKAKELEYENKEQFGKLRLLFPNESVPCSATGKINLLQTP